MGRRRTQILLAIVIAIVLTLGGATFGASQGQSPVLLTVSVLDVGQGDSILVSTSDTYGILIDGGPREASSAIVSALDRASIDKLGVLIGTHPHADHIGGLVDLLDHVPIGG